MDGIVAIDNNYAIGNQGKLLFNIKEDMDFFKKMTSGPNHIVVMGSKTYKSIGRELPNRLNIILSRTPDKYTKQGLTSFDEHEFNIIKESYYKDYHIYIIGGAEIYNLYMDQCDKFYVTHIDTEASEADAYINADKFHSLFNWNKVINSGEQDGIKWKICEYIKK